MAKTYRGGNSVWILFLLLLAGGLVGSAISSSLANILPFLAATGKIGLQPSTLDLQFMQITFGFTFNIGPVTALGLVLGYIVYRRI
ncbi:DUF4321 domain-containing protein [Desulfoscipio gibsoniae]|uniref:DUF4321 domain-containing protein n=1 Tax=Desulfoscipio gibsoniae DSM 7213 TaxID=767817 RepID=R4KHG1_9FIRM|nr:DUF4321 domain-containing protein [Desulfoscipio gibsoniae]AGL02653.1 hypothetical protein Desgi_3307 [Desulfoscipio gibsoniae DSM 7213]